MPCRIAMLCLLFSVAVEAAVYRCEVGGKPVYTDQPCAAGVAPHRMPQISTVPAAADADLAKEHDARIERGRAAREKGDAAWLKEHAESKEQEARMNAAIADKKALKDMTPDQVRRALGSPDEVERTSGSETWVYGGGKTRQMVLIENGRVVKISGRKK